MLLQDLTEEPIARSGPISVRSPGTDSNFCASWEPTVSVDPNNQEVVAVAQDAQLIAADRHRPARFIVGQDLAVDHVDEGVVPGRDRFVEAGAGFEPDVEV